MHKIIESNIIFQPLVCKYHFMPRQFEWFWSSGRVTGGFVPVRKLPGGIMPSRRMTGGILHGGRLKWREADWWGDELGEGRTGRRVIGMN